MNLEQNSKEREMFTAGCLGSKMDFKKTEKYSQIKNGEQ
jgi:hypothetical protein